MERAKSNGRILFYTNTRGKNKTRNILFRIASYTKSHRNGRYSFLLFTYFSILISSKILAEGIDTTNLPNASPKTSTSNIPADLAEEFSTEALWFGVGEEISIATRHETPISKAPSIVTVITAEEIKHLGYRSLVEILRIVPGFEILKSGDFGVTSPTVRGLIGSEHMRIMLNGHFVNNPFGGGAFILFDDFPVENIQRIEIIRGPGSAVYGENAFSAAINIITKGSKDIDGVRVSSGYGSFDTYEENIVFGKTCSKVTISGMAHYRQTTGFDGIVKEDSLSPAPFSQAPGKVDDGRQEYTLNLRVSYNNIYAEGLYINKNQGPFIGPQFALNDETDLESNYVFVETGYKKTFHEKVTVKPRIYYDQFDNNYFVESLPEGTTVPLGDRNGDGIPDFVAYPDGLIGNGMVTQKIVGTEIPADYELFDGNTLTLGFEYRLINQTNAHFSSNFDTETRVPKDFSTSPDFIKETTRRIWSVYLQDTWDITDTVNLTLGARYDQYSDFSSQTSPRAGFTWSFMKDASLKLLYGEAFRAPNFVELFTTNNPAIQGNPDLDPETIRTYEIGLSYRFNKHISSSINYFYNDIKDLIVLRSQKSNDTRRYENFGNARVQGIEMETRVNIVKDNYIFMNYSFQHSEGNNGNDLPFVAEHKGNFGVNVHYGKYINTNVSTFVSGSRSRDDNDPKEDRDDLPSYALLNLSIIAKEFFKTLEVQGTVFNLLDKDYSDPGPGPTSFPGDFPRPERTFFVGLSYQF